MYIYPRPFGYCSKSLIIEIYHIWMFASLKKNTSYTTEKSEHYLIFYVNTLMDIQMKFIPRMLERFISTSEHFQILHTCRCV